MNDIDWLRSMIPLATPQGAIRLNRIAETLEKQAALNQKKLEHSSFGVWPTTWVA